MGANDVCSDGWAPIQPQFLHNPIATSKGQPDIGRLVALLAAAIPAVPALAVSTVVIGSSAALVQVLGLVRWPFAVPELARRYVGAEGPDAATTRETIGVVFATLHRLFGVGIGEHLGYVLTGLWTILVSASILSTSVIWPWLGWIGLPVGAALLIGSLEFVGSNEKAGWSIAGTIVPIGYVAWSLWLVAIGIGLIL